MQEMSLMIHKKKIAVLGPVGTFSDEAVKSHWGEEAELIYAKNFTEIFEKVTAGIAGTSEADIGIVPTEDSESGDVLESLDLLEEYPLYIVGELQHEVKHFLLGKETIDKLKVIGSHKKPLTHCRKYLYTNFPNLRIKEMDSTAAAAEKASKDPTFGAIGSERLAKLYNLNILASEIHDKGGNETRFLIVSPKETSLKEISRKSPVKTSIIVHTKKDKPGVLAEILNVFAKKKINLTRIVSRPEGGVIGKYNFFLTLEGRKDEPKLKSALQKLSTLKSVTHYRDFGSYSTIKHEAPVKKAKKSSLDLLRSTFAFWDNEEDQVYDTF